MWPLAGLCGTELEDRFWYGHSLWIHMPYGVGPPYFARVSRTEPEKVQTEV